MPSALPAVISHVVAAQRDRHRCDQRVLGQGVEVVHVGAQCARAHGEHHVVDGGIGVLGDQPQPFERPGPRREPAGPADRHVEHGLGRVQRERAAALVQSPIHRTGERGYETGDLADRAAGDTEGGRGQGERVHSAGDRRLGRRRDRGQVALPASGSHGAGMSRASGSSLSALRSNFIADTPSARAW